MPGMKKLVLLVGIVIIVVAVGLVVFGQAPSKSNGPVFTADNQLVKPANYREWVWLSSGLGMTYNSEAQANADPHFDNVFVTPEAYQAFLKTGKWPNKTMFVLEFRASRTSGSINKAGHFQGDLVGIEAEVKDESRFKERWGFFPFRGNDQRRSRRIPQPPNAWPAILGTAPSTTRSFNFIQHYSMLQNRRARSSRHSPRQSNHPAALSSRSRSGPRDRDRAA